MWDCWKKRTKSYLVIKVQRAAGADALPLRIEYRSCGKNTSCHSMHITVNHLKTFSCPRFQPAKFPLDQRVIGLSGGNKFPSQYLEVG